MNNLRRLAQTGDAKLFSEYRRQAILFALLNLDFHYQAGNVAVEDYYTFSLELLTEVAKLMQGKEV